MKGLILQQFEHSVNILDDLSPTQLPHATAFKTLMVSLGADMLCFTRLYNSVLFSLENYSSVIIFFSF